MNILEYITPGMVLLIVAMFPIIYYVAKFLIPINSGNVIEISKIGELTWIAPEVERENLYSDDITNYSTSGFYVFRQVEQISVRFRREKGWLKGKTSVRYFPADLASAFKVGMFYYASDSSAKETIIKKERLATDEEVENYRIQHT